jgi:hypothetical protein
MNLIGAFCVYATAPNKRLKLHNYKIMFKKTTLVRRIERAEFDLILNKTAAAANTNNILTLGVRPYRTAHGFKSSLSQGQYVL